MQLIIDYLPCEMAALPPKGQAISWGELLIIVKANDNVMLSCGTPRLIAGELWPQLDSVFIMEKIAKLIARFFNG